MQKDRRKVVVMADSLVERTVAQMAYPWEQDKVGQKVHWKAEMMVVLLGS